ncbi:MAG: FAD-binding protein [Bauldia sp.]
MDRIDTASQRPPAAPRSAAAPAPATEGELAALIAEAATRRAPLAIAGGGTRAGFGRPVDAAPLSTRGLSGITLYEPAELVISARAGTPLSVVERELGSRGQMLPFEPFDHRPLYGSAGEPTVGGLVAVNASGSRRIQAGAVRDSLIGVRAVTGTAEIVKSGGRVMKNVTGYDLVKLLAGSHGTLAVISEATFKVLPAAETEATLVVSGLDDAAAVAALSAGLGSPFSVTGGAHVPGRDGAPATTAIRLEGFAASVADRAARLAIGLKRFASSEILDAGSSRSLWRGIAALAPLAAGESTPLWRLSLKPSAAPAVVAAIRAACACRVLYDWGGGLVWVAGGEGADAGAAVVRGAIAGLPGAHATLMRAPQATRRAVPVFQPEAAPLAMLSARLKREFDPAGILNPGRMVAGV